ncbi:MAG: hypothetical protein LBR27_03950 [Bifidobacteriaceae bacterium]|nr:hypothetical protein [Bifidobacteriaceae bacterium]
MRDGLDVAPVVDDVDPFEERHVAQAAQGLVDGGVEGVGVACQVDEVVEVGEGLFVGVAGGVDLDVQEGQPPGDVVLLFLEEVEGDGPLVVGVEEGLALGQ